MTARTVTILAADVVGYSRLIASAEEETLHRLKDLHTLFDEYISKNNGHIFTRAGDAVKATFDSEFDAVTAAWELQKRLRGRNAGYALEQQMLHRIGLSTGEVVDVQGELHGISIAIASSMEALAAPGGICVTRAVHDAVAGEKLWRFEPLGPVRVAAAPVAIEAFALLMGPGASSAIGGERIASTSNGFGTKVAVLMSVSTLVAMGAALTYVVQNLDPKAGIAPKQPDTARSDATFEARPRPDAAAPPSPTNVKSPPTLEVQPAPTSPGPLTRDPPAKSDPTIPQVPAVQTVGPSAGPSVTEPATPSLPTSVPPPQAQWTTANLEDCFGTVPQRTVPACRALLEADDPQVRARSAEIGLKLGTALREAGRTEEAVTSLARVAEAQPTSAVFIQLGAARYEMGQLEAAIEDFSAALKLDARDGEAYNNRAWVRFKAGRLDEAAADVRLAQEYAGTKAFVWDTSGHINEAMGRNDLAIADFRKALSLDPQLATSKAGLSRLGAKP